MKHFLRFWFVNRITLIIAVWVATCIVLATSEQATFNLYLWLFSFAFCSMHFVHIVQVSKHNASERLMCGKLLRFFNELLNED